MVVGAVLVPQTLGNLDLPLVAQPQVLAVLSTDHVELGTE